MIHTEDEFALPDIEGLNTRKIALSILNEVLNRKQALDVSLSRSHALTVLPSRDRAFARMMIATTLRRLGQIDALIDNAKSQDSPLPNGLPNIIRIGAVQLLFMNVPDHAAVDTAVRLVDEMGLSRYKGLVNGILRTLGRTGQELVAQQDTYTLNTPDWLRIHWERDYGLETARNIAAAHLSEAPLDITLKNPADRDYWVGTLEAIVLPTGQLRRVQGGAVHELSGFSDGQWWVQDASAALPATLFGDVKNRTIYDLCAAPGGKTMQLAAMGANVVAIDRSAQRLKRLQDNITRVNLQDRVDVRPMDASVWKPAEAAPFILMDAPCSATGTMRRNPDIGTLKTEEDMARLLDLQTRLLHNALNHLAVEGILIYCTCSLQKAEGEDQIAKALKNNGNIRRLPVQADEIGGLPQLLSNVGDVRILPTHLAANGGMDGFYVARLQKIS